jgi:hypothetical protein
MTFGAEEGHGPPGFQCGWGPRAETATEVARRVQALNAPLAEIEPAHREIWPLFAARAIRPGSDPGPVLDMAVEDLAAVIERKARFDPPRPPAPVGDTGYNLILSANRTGLDPLTVGISLHAGAYNTGHAWNGGRVDYHASHPIWRDPVLGLRVLGALIESLEPDWACAATVVDVGTDPHVSYPEDRHGRSWFAWTAPGRETPEFWLRANGPPAEQREALGGVLRFWP